MNPRPLPTKWAVVIKIHDKRQFACTVSATSEASARFKSLERARVVGYSNAVLSDIVSARLIG